MTLAITFFFDLAPILGPLLGLLILAIVSILWAYFGPIP